MHIQVPNQYSQPCASFLFLLLSITSIASCSTIPRLHAKRDDTGFFHTYQLITKENSDRKNCTELFEEKTIRGYGTQEVNGLLEGDDLQQKVEQVLADIDKYCEKKEFSTRKSLAELAASKPANYFDESRPEFTEFGYVIPESREKGSEIYIELMCETSGGSPPTRDANGLKRWHSNLHAPQCEDFDVFEQSCQLQNRVAKAHTHICPAAGKYQKYETSDKTLFSTAVDKLKGILGKEFCWYRRYVFAALIAKECSAEMIGPDGKKVERAGGIVRFAAWVNQAEGSTDKPKFSLVYVIDGKLYNSCEDKGGCEKE
ncbi:hypothetical protein BJ508DRAFT_334663 [Ascobolus immersus RN42]|uniref:Lysine-specific metallo-endopeptidase domain-containing protein n=1 Tax=Ascobolus immersus RN42 TaxID=1160509 RepID=A0A3N4HL36_ASCIM|nr:hypothetical protein BJ508DRAFT_334663 [Ascobolus immersus RN42]